MKNNEIMSAKDLSRFWYCSDDKTRLRTKTERTAHNPVFKIIKNKFETSFNNAVAIRKIPAEAKDSVEEISNYIFKNSDLEEIELASTECPNCHKRYASPKLNKIVELPGVNIGRALYDNQKALATKDYGRFRFVNRFGLGSGNQNQGGTRGLRGLFFLGWFIGFFYIFAVIFLYYFLGFEMKVGKRFVPVGPILVIVFLLGFLFFLVTNDLLKPIWDLISSFSRR